MHHIQKPRRNIPIVPAIPRKFERKPRPSNNGVTDCSALPIETAKSTASRSSTNIDGVCDQLQTVGDRLDNSPEEENLVGGQQETTRSEPKVRKVSSDIGRLGVGPDNSRSPNGKIRVPIIIKEEAGNQVLEFVAGPKSVTEENKKLDSEAEGRNNAERADKSSSHPSSSETAGEGTRFVTAVNDIQNLVTENTGFQLPSPIYPQSFQSLPPSHSQFQIQKSQPHSQYPSVAPNPFYPPYSTTEHPSSYYIATPPMDDSNPPTAADYRGYGHISYTSLQPGYTPPTDPIPSPKNDSCKTREQNPEGSKDVQESSSTMKRSPSPCLFYQGYAYGNFGLDGLPNPGNPPSNQDVSPINSLPSQRHENLATTSDNAQPDDHSNKSYVISHKSPEDGTFMLTNTLRQHAAKTNDGDNKSRRSWAPVPSSASSLDSFHQRYPLANSGIHNWDSFASETLNHEDWRSATLHSLNPATETLPKQSPLAAHLLDQFENEKYADIHLEVIHERDGLVMADFKVHSLIMAQNRFCQDLLDGSPSESQGLRLLRLRTNESFITPQAIRGALRVFYGEPAYLFMDSCLQIDFSKDSATTSLTWMENALAFAASGYLLGLDEVIDRALRVASSILSWDNIEKAISFALHGGLDPSLDPDHALRVESLVSLAKTSTDCIPLAIRGASESLRQRSRPRSGYRTPLSQNASGRRSALLFMCLNFIASEFPMSWDLDTSACPFAEIDRLPMTAKSHSPSTKSRLVSIRFGDYPPEIHSLPRHRNTVLSSILLSLPFIPLKYLLQHVTEPTKSRIAGPIVDERERRRIQVLQEGEAGWSQRIIDADHFAYIGWKELISSKKDSYLVLERKWMNFEESHST